MARRIADCLENHLHEFGWDPYRYPSGEHKGVHAEFADDGSTIFLFTSLGGPTFRLEIVQEPLLRV